MWLSRTTLAMQKYFCLEVWLSRLCGGLPLTSWKKVHPTKFCCLHPSAALLGGGMCFRWLSVSKPLELGSSVSKLGGCSWLQLLLGSNLDVLVAMCVVLLVVRPQLGALERKPKMVLP